MVTFNDDGPMSFSLAWLSWRQSTEVDPSCSTRSGRGYDTIVLGLEGIASMFSLFLFRFSLAGEYEGNIILERATPADS